MDDTTTLSAKHEFPYLTNGARVIQREFQKKLVDLLDTQISDFTQRYGSNYQIIVGTDSQKIGALKKKNDECIDKRSFGTVVIFDAGSTERRLIMHRHIELRPFGKKAYLLKELENSVFILKKLVRNLNDNKVPIFLEVDINISDAYGSNIAYIPANEMLRRKNTNRIIQNFDVSVQFKGSLSYTDEAIRVADRLCRGKFGF